ncbi:helix-turn-helix transcriptional regulator [Mesorhizobium muleiense]|uniref:helix-turn-helix domain-containing protein n=2 Tax=Mesorhizobium TaxID=68287 RepID=UPI001F1F4A0C|nr:MULTISPECIES: helix-turn-helix transcriptional regulator [Mesorhizobium]MCF6120860.1 helix-turn-helix transcriptional regulator [Mesorhizobium muleiense]
MAVKPSDEAQPVYFFREWRKRRGLNQETLAEMVGLTASSISQLENGKQGFTDSTLAAIARALECRPGDLLLWGPDEIEASTAPIRGDQEILAVLQRIEGLSTRDIDVAFGVISNALKVNKAESEQVGADGRSQLATPRRESSPLR